MDDIIDTHTREDLLEDGDLITAPEPIARRAGFHIPVDLTRAVWADCVEWTEQDTELTRVVWQEQDARLGDVLHWAHRAALRAADRGGRVEFTAYRLSRQHRPELGDPEALPVRLAMTLGPGDEGDPVITISTIDED
jgi:hypothetical protein